MWTTALQDDSNQSTESDRNIHLAFKGVEME